MWWMSEANGPRTNHGPRTRGKDTTPLTVAEEISGSLVLLSQDLSRGFGMT